MKFRLDKKCIYWGLTAFSVVVASVLFYFIIAEMPVWIGWIDKLITILYPVIYGAAIAYLLNPLVKWLEKSVYKLLKKLKISISTKSQTWIRLFVVFVSIALAAFAIYGLLALLIPEVIASITNIIENFPRYVSNVEIWITEQFSDNSNWDPALLDMLNKYSLKMENWLTDVLLPQLESLVKNFSIGVIGFLKFIYNFVIGILISIYVLVGKENFAAGAKRVIYAFIPTDSANAFIHNVRFADQKFGQFFIGKIIDSAIIGVLCYIGTSILKMPYALLVSVIVGVTNIIPFFGPFLGAVPSALLILCVSPLKCVYFIIFVFALQQLDGNIIGPKILGDSTGISSFAVIVAILLGGGLMGVLGMFIAVPCCAVIVSFARLIIERRLRNKNLPLDLEVYKNMESIEPETKEVTPLKIDKNRQAKLKDKKIKTASIKGTGFQEKDIK